MIAVFYQCKNIISILFNNRKKIYDNIAVQALSYYRLDKFVERNKLSYKDLVIILELCCNYIQEHHNIHDNTSVKNFYISKTSKKIFYNIRDNNKDVSINIQESYNIFFDSFLLVLMKNNSSLYIAYIIYCSNFMKKLNVTYIKI